MNLKILIPLLVAATGILSAEPTPNTQPDYSPPPPPPDRDGKGSRDKMKENLPPEIRERFEAAREKALQDPAVRELKKKAEEAGEDFRKAMREAIMKADPGLKEILKDKFQGKQRDWKPGPPPGFANLSEADRKKLMDAREKAKDDPEVQAAEKKRSSASTPEEQKAAMEDFHKAMKAALLKVDPTLAPVLEKLKPPHDRPPGPPQGPPPGPPPGEPEN